MLHTDYTGIIPEQYTGKEIEAEAFVELEEEQQAKRFYEMAKGRLLQVNQWHVTAGPASAQFQLVDEHGEAVDRHAQKGDRLRIDIPGPGNGEGDGYDWVMIEELNEVAEDDHQSIGFRVRPTRNPFGIKNETAHFYSEESTSNFIVTREKLKVIAWIIDCNTTPNAHADSLIDKVRNVVVGASAIRKFSEVQWKNLAEGLVKP